MSVLIKSVERDTPAQKAGILPFEKIVSINGNPINDVLDYRFYMTDTKLSVELEEADGKKRFVEVKKSEYEDLGLDFETYLMDKERSCKNKCIFCFIDQMPPNMRETLYFKDDDARLGFLFGNYVTLTNLNDHDIDRIITMHLSPINVSVHTTNPELRVKMMKNPRAGECLGYLKRLADAGIKLHIQLVLCPGINDGEELRRSLGDLSALGDAVESVVCVPVGLTKYRDNLPKLKPYDEDTASKVIDLVDNFRNEMLARRDFAGAYAADEFYIKAKRPFPAYEYYEEFTQLEDGVGLCVLLRHEFTEALDYFPKAEYRRHVTIPTGKAAYTTLKAVAKAAEEKYEGLKIDVIAMENYFFGEEITVTGLLTGGDFVKQLKDRDNGDAVLICDCTLRYEHDKFIDDRTPECVEREIGTPVLMLQNDGYKLLCAMLGEDDTETCEVIYG